MREVQAEQSGAEQARAGQGRPGPGRIVFGEIGRAIPIPSDGRFGHLSFGGDSGLFGVGTHDVDCPRGRRWRLQCVAT